ncbi:MAG: FmdB family transcriptional regulator [Acidimicrobiaceae bacterium]|nr:FmdB family transcriptional regulator [Acidimicrobiaceae bacterium]
MPTYEFRCRTCDDTFEVRRSMSESGDPAACPDGHADTVRLLSVFARTGGSTAAAPFAPSAATSSGGCCGGGCGCAH